MSNNLNPSESQVKVANSMPLGYMLCILTGIIGILLTINSYTGKQRADDCEAVAAGYRRDIEGLKADNKYLLGIVLGQGKEIKEIRHNTDSVIRAKVNN